MREQYGLTMEEKSGIRFGNYELVGRIDIGGMGEVYLAHQLTAFGRPVAIKIIRPDLAHDTTARARFLREAEVSAHLKHEHILPLYDFGEADGRLFLVTPYIEGGTLAARLKNRGPLSLSDTRKLLVPLVQAVAYIHRRGVIHRDLKPTNVMLDTEDGEVYVRLIDFGIASLQGHNASPALTTAGHEIGTIAYMAPERLSGIAAPSNDIFSLGVILHQMLTAHMPTLAPPTPGATPPRLPEPLVQVIRRSTAANPAERYATADELLKGFEQAYNQVIGLTQPGTLPDEAGTSALVTNSLVLERSEPISKPLISHSHPERVSLSRSGEVAAPVSEQPVPMTSRPPLQGRFAPEDYNAPTTSFQAAQMQQYSQPPTHRPPLLKPPKPRQPRQGKRNPLLVIITLVSLFLLVIVGGLLFYGYQAVSAANVSINFSPQVHTINQTISLKADPKTQAVNLSQATIPARVVSASQTQQLQGTTTGQNCPVFFYCQQVVSQEDVNGLVEQIQQMLNPNISKTLQTKITAAHGTQIGSVSIFNQTITSSPQVNQPGKSVTVTLSEQGSAGYILQSDITKVVQQKLAEAVTKLGPGFEMVSSTVNIGHAAIAGTDPNSGLISINVPAGTIALYKFTPTQLQAISTGLLGKSLLQAKTFLKSQPGINPNSVSIHFTSGNGSTMPGDVGHIKLIPVNPGELPSISLTPVQGTPIGSQ